MDRKLIRYLIIAFSCLTVLYPVWVGLKDIHWVFDSNLLLDFFHIFGLLGFTLLWLHVVGAAIEEWLNKYIDFEKFVRNTTNVILVCILIHPFLLLVRLGFSVNKIFMYYGLLYILLAIIGWLLLITYDIGRTFNNHDFFVQNWNKILFLSTLGVLFIFFHSLGLGSDLQSGPLRILWIFYGVTAILATIYSFVIKKIINKN